MDKSIQVRIIISGYKIDLMTLRSRGSFGIFGRTFARKRHGKTAGHPLMRLLGLIKSHSTSSALLVKAAPFNYQIACLWHLGFDYNFDALHAKEDQPNELYVAITQSLSQPRSILGFMQLSIPGLRSLVRVFSKHLNAAYDKCNQ